MSYLLYLMIQRDENQDKNSNSISEYFGCFENFDKRPFINRFLVKERELKLELKFSHV